MAETVDESAPEVPAAPVQAEDILGLGREIPRAVSQALEAEDTAAAAEIVGPLHYAEIADLIEQLAGEPRRRLVEFLSPRFDPNILHELGDTVRDEVVEQLGVPALARAIAHLESDDALFLISSLRGDIQRRVLRGIPVALRAALEEGLSYPEDSAGRLMQRAFVAVPTFWTVGDAIDFTRESEDLPDEFYDMIVVDPRHRPVGAVSLSRVLRTKRPVAIRDIMGSDIVRIPAGMDQEEVAYIFAQHDLVSAPVVDDGGRLIGVIMVDDVVDVIHEEAEEDLMRLGGVSTADLYDDVIDTGRSRFSWLFVNLLTAVLASVVIGFFEGTIQQIVFLAVLMPIAASMGGNAGTQTLTVAVRAIAMKDLTPANAWRVLTKEVLVGVLNGILFAALIGALAWLWSGTLSIGLVMAAAMSITMVMAGLAGAAIPLILSRAGIDPAVASAVFVTTVTDVVAFLAFLGLAAWFLL